MKLLKNITVIEALIMAVVITVLVFIIYSVASSGAQEPQRSVVVSGHEYTIDEARDVRTQLNILFESGEVK